MDKFSEKELMEIASQVGQKEWKKLGLLLNFSWTELFKFIYDNRDLGHSGIVFSMLSKWQSEFYKRQTQDCTSTSTPRSVYEKSRKLALKCTPVKKLVATNSSLREDLFLYRVAEHVGKRWKELGYHLGLFEGELQFIEQDNGQNCADAAMETLVKWRNANADRPECFSNFLHSLRKVGLSELSNIIAQFHRQQIQPEHLEFSKDDEMKQYILLGFGAFGKVFRATYIPILEPVAVKMIHSGTPLPPDVQQLLLHEVKNMLEIQSNHTVGLYGMLMDNSKDQYAVVMELMPNGSLEDMLDKTVLNCGIKTKIALDICQGVSYIHSKGMIHQDIKARNVLLDSTFKARLGDFGQARIIHLTSTHTKNIHAGTPTHRAPEMLNPKLPKTKAIDIWSCGITFFQLFAEKCRNKKEIFKRLPFNEGITSEQIMFSLGILKESPISEEQIDAKISADCPKLFLSIMKAATQFNPDDRPHPSKLLSDIKDYFHQNHASSYIQQLKQMATSLGRNVSLHESFDLDSRECQMENGQSVINGELICKLCKLKFYKFLCYNLNYLAT